MEAPWRFLASAVAFLAPVLRVGDALVLQRGSRDRTSEDLQALLNVTLTPELREGLERYLQENGYAADSVWGGDPPTPAQRHELLESGVETWLSNVLLRSRKLSRVKNVGSDVPPLESLLSARRILRDDFPMLSEDQHLTLQRVWSGSMTKDDVEVRLPTSQPGHSGPGIAVTTPASRVESRALAHDLDQSRERSENPRFGLESGTTGSSPTGRHKVVLARYDEDIEWSKMYAKLRTVYCKGNASSESEGCIQLPNVGRESHTYLHHVVTRYDSLANWTVFSHAQAPTLGYPGAGLAGHMMNGVSFHDYVLGGGPFKDSSDARFVFNGAIKVDDGQLWHRLSKNYHWASKWSGVRAREPCQIHGVDVSPATKFTDFQTFLADAYFGGNFSRVPEALMEYAEDLLGARGNQHPTLFFSQGARFAVSRERIRTRPRAFYERLLNLVSGDVSPCAGFFNEWLWYYIMGTPPSTVC